MGFLSHMWAHPLGQNAHPRVYTDCPATVINFKLNYHSNSIEIDTVLYIKYCGLLKSNHTAVCCLCDKYHIK